MSDESPGGYVVVLFGHEADGWCTSNKCPMGSVKWFPTNEAARRYADSMPEAFEPHILFVERDRGSDRGRLGALAGGEGGKLRRNPERLLALDFAWALGLP